MEIKNAYIVNIDFDGDICESKYCWGVWRVFTALEEVKTVISEALTDLMRHQKKWGRDETISIGHKDVPIADVLANSRKLEKFIKQGGCKIRSWKIKILMTGA